MTMRACLMMKNGLVNSQAYLLPWQFLSVAWASLGWHHLRPPSVPRRLEFARCWAHQFSTCGKCCPVILHGSWYGLLYWLRRWPIISQTNGYSSMIIGYKYPGGFL